jgi:hypothetical protein
MNRLAQMAAQMQAAGPAPDPKMQEVQAKQQDIQARIQMDQDKAQREGQMEQYRFQFEQMQHKNDMDLQWAQAQQQMELEREKHANELAHKERLARMEADAYSTPEMLTAKQNHERQMAQIRSRQPAPGIDPQQHIEILRQLTQAMHALAQAHSAPRQRRLIRDSSGRASHAIDEVIH